MLFRLFIESMIIWVFIITLIAVALVFHTRLSKKTQSILILAIVAFFIVVYSQRRLGMDIGNYEKMYNQMTAATLLKDLKPSKLLSGAEPLYKLMMLFGHTLHLSFYQWFPIVVAVPSCLFYLYIVNKTEYPLIGYMLFMVMMMYQFDLTRLFLALPFLLYAFSAKNKFAKVGLYVVAIGFHYSCVFIFLCECVVRLLYNHKLDLAAYILTLIGAIVLKNVDWSVFEGSQLGILGKIQSYMENGWANDREGLCSVLYYVINLYPTLMSFGLLLCIQSIEPPYLEGDTASKQKLTNILQTGVFLSLAALPLAGPQVMFRIQVLFYTLLFIPLTKPVAIGLQGKTLYKRATFIVLSLMAYNVFMAMYYNEVYKMIGYMF